MDEDIGTIYLRDVIERFRAYKKLGERAIAQVYDSGLTVRVGPESNSIAVLVRHLAGNMRSRWTGFLTSDGEKPDRNREQEFVVPESVSRRELLEWWDDGWARLFEALVGLRAPDLTRQVTIRGQPYLALQAIDVALTHYAYHVGQIVLLAKHLAGDSWTTLTIPRQSNV
jgi:Protein of unknown function (DUF1572)